MQGMRLVVAIVAALLALGHELSASDGLIPSLADDGSVRFLGSGGTAVVLPAPVLFDKSGAEPRAVHYVPAPEEAGHRLRNSSAPSRIGLGRDQDKHKGRNVS